MGFREGSLVAYDAGGFLQRKNILVPHLEHRTLFRAAVAPPPPDDDQPFIERIEVALIKGAEVP